MKGFFLLVSCLNFSVCVWSQHSDDSTYTDLKIALEDPLAVKVLRLDDKGVEVLPQEISKMRNLERLTLQHNENLKIAQIIQQLSRLRKLKVLDFSYSKIDSLPKDISGLLSLEKLILGETGIKYIPDEIEKLPHLRCIVFSQYPADFRSWDKEEKLRLLSLLPEADILLVDYFGGVHGNFRLGKKSVKVTKKNLY